MLIWMTKDIKHELRSLNEGVAGNGDENQPETVKRFIEMVHFYFDAEQLSYCC